MLRGGKNGHIHANLRDDANSGKGLDTYMLCKVRCLIMPYRHRFLLAKLHHQE